MKSEIRTFTYDNGEIQKVQLVHPEKWSDIDTLKPSFDPRAFERICSLYKSFIVPARPEIFGRLVMFYLPEDVQVPFSYETEKYGTVGDPLTAVAAAFRAHLKVRSGKPVFTDPAVGKLYEQLKERGACEIICGKLPMTTILPFDRTFGFLSECEQDAAMKCNAGFFIFDKFDCATVYDKIGTAFGMVVKNGVVINPPLYHREALIARNDGSVSVEIPRMKDLSVEIDGTIYDNTNSHVYMRPGVKKTPAGGVDVVLVGTKIVAVHPRGKTDVPASGFVLKIQNEDARILAGEPVIYHGMEDVVFAIQAGNSILVDGKKTEKFISSFYNIRTMGTPYPPSLYPLDFEKARAPRMAIGEMEDGTPAIAWMEGKGKFGHVPGEESCGASLSEMAELCQALGMKNAVNMDGGGSSQILIKNERSLRISDRDPATLEEVERAVPIGLIVR